MNGVMLRDAIISAANNIGNMRQQVDALNVFPVPDGDTGTNMSMTIAAAKRELERLGDEATVTEVANIAAAALLRGARGNSGVILSLLFRGFSKGLSGKQTAEPRDIANALSMGVDAAYKAVMKPTEGTILTVVRLAAEHIQNLVREPIEMPALWDAITQSAAEALAQTPEMLPVLKKAGVVDAGGKGILVIFEGMSAVIHGGPIVASNESGDKKEAIDDDTFRNAAGEFDGVINYTYCTEFIVNKEEPPKEIMALRAYLESIGDSVVVVDDDDIIKCHVHTDIPGNALNEAQKFGWLTNMKIENMREQHARQRQSVQRVKEEFEYVPVDPMREYGFVVVAAGEGVKRLFTDLGVDNIVSGGQTMNPSTDDILRAVHATPAKTVFVMPNNKNIIMAAEQAINLADRRVCVLQSRTIPQGLSAMLAFDPENDRAQNQLNMTKAIANVGTGQLTFAARDSDFDGHKIKKGELLAMENGKLAFTDKDLGHAALKLIRSLLKKDTSFITAIYGEDVTEEQAEKLETLLRAKLPNDVELAMIKGGQPIYYLILSVE